MLPLKKGLVVFMKGYRLIYAKDKNNKPFMQNNFSEKFRH